MNTRTKCIITGCAIRLEHSSDYAWGDLHIQGDRFIFNATLDRDGQTAWHGAGCVEHACNTLARTVQINMGEDYFERRGVFVFAAKRSSLNPEARAHVDKWEPYLFADLES
jgi:hypothetical protein